MKKNEFILEAKAKENAMKYFPGFFEADYTISNEMTVEGLSEKYLKYCESYFTRFDQNADFERMQIKKAYDYMKNVLEHRGKTYQVKSNIAKQLFAAYEELSIELYRYTFNYRWNNSYGDRQNQTNNHIVDEISFLKPMLHQVVANINSHFEKITDVTKISDFDNQLREKLEDLINWLKSTAEELGEAREHYRSTWNSIKYGIFYNGYPTHSDLGVAKKEWKWARNNTCYVILNFYKKLQEINMSLPTESLFYPLGETNEIYNSCIKNIISGPNYYSYLNEEERQNETEQNLIRKQKL